MDYTNLLKRAWEIVWNNKFMFVLGFLAALAGGSGGGGSNFSTGGPGSGGDDINIPPEIAANIERYWAEYATILIVLVIFFIMLGIVFWLVSLVGKAGLISSAARLDAGESVSFGEAFSVGSNKLVSMVGLNLLLYGPFIVAGLVAFLIAAATVGSVMVAEISGASGNLEGMIGAFGGLFVCFGLLACLLVPFSLLVNVVYPFSLRGLVLYDYGVVDSVRHGWQVVRDNVGEVIVLIVIFLVIGFLFGIVAAAVLVPLGALLFLPTILPMINSGTITVANAVFLVLAGIVVGIAAAALNSVLIAYRSTAVTLAYQQFIGKTNPNKLVQTG